MGCVHQGELHVTPLKGVLYLRPSFGYLDRVDKKHAVGGVPGNVPDESEEPEEPEATPVTVRYESRSFSVS